jgi:ribose-phosphate pyrophosphokinase
MPNSVILPGSHSIFLAESISKLTEIPSFRSKLVNFVNSEMKITLPEEIENYTKAIIVQSTSIPVNDSLMELLLTADTLKMENISDITAIIPYFGYARQDKQHLPRECVSVEMICRLLANVGINRVLTVDIHNQKVLEKVNLEIENLSAMPFLAREIYKDMGLNSETEKEITIASPDDGGIARAELFAKNFYQNPENMELVSIKKQRHLDKTHYCEAVELRGEIKDKKVILIDDISTSGGTILNALELCKVNGVREVSAVIIHADFAHSVCEKFENSDLVKVYTTNTIEKTVENLDYYKKVKVIDIAEIFVGRVG